MSVYDVLWKNVPQTLKNNELVREYIEAISEVFDEIRDDINRQKYNKDYLKTDAVELNNLAEDFGIDFPRNVSEDIQRLFVRDANQVFARLGTRRSLEWALRMLNVTQFEISEIWAPNPDLLRQGYYRELQDTSDPIRYTLTPLSYVDFYTGTEVVKPNGVFFEGYAYDDIDKENLITDIPIFGETYKNYTQVDFNNTVSKTPYVVVRIFDDNFNDLVQDYTDPDTGQTYSYTARERQKIINQLIEYFVQVLHRTANTKIIVVSDILYFVDELPLINDDLFIEALQEEIDLESTLQTIADSYSTTSQIDTQLTTQVGNGIPIGEHPFYSVGEYTTHVIGENQGPIPINEDASQIPYNYDVRHYYQDFEHYVYMDINAQVSFTNNFPGSVVTVESKQNRWHSNSWQSIQTLQYGDSFNESYFHVHCLRMSFDNISLTADTTGLTADSSYTTDIDSSELTVNMDISY